MARSIDVVVRVARVPVTRSAASSPVPRPNSTSRSRHGLPLNARAPAGLDARGERLTRPPGQAMADRWLDEPVFS